jgi:small subunit ribosomal protein S9
MAESQRPDEPEEEQPEQPQPEEAAAEPAAEEQPETPAEPAEPVAEQPEPAAEPEAPAQQPVAEEPAEPPQAEPPQAEPPAEEQPAAETPAAEHPQAVVPAEPPQAEQPAADAPAEQPVPEQPAAEQPAAEAPAEQPAAEGAEQQAAPPRRERPGSASGPDVIPGADLEPDIVPEGFDPLGRGLTEEDALPEGVELVEEDVLPEGEAETGEPEERVMPQAAIDLAAGARYTATGKRKTAVARVILRPGSGAYTINGRTLEEFFPRMTLQRNIRQPLETVGYEARMDVHARLHGGGVSAQAGALRHGISRALIAADPNLRGELKRRGFLTRDARAKERKKAGLKKARKRPQFSKR